MSGFLRVPLLASIVDVCDTETGFVAVRPGSPSTRALVPFDRSLLTIQSCPVDLRDRPAVSYTIDKARIVVAYSSQNIPSRGRHLGLPREAWHSYTRRNTPRDLYRGELLQETSGARLSLQNHFLLHCDHE